MAEAENMPVYSLRLKLTRKKEDEEHLNECNVNKKFKQRESYERWKKRMKSNTNEYEKHKRVDAEKHRQARRDMSDEKRKIYNAKARERMRRYRERKRLSDENEVKKKTRNQIQKQRQYWREKKIEQRSRMSDERRLIEKERRRQKYQESKIKKKLNFESTPITKRLNLSQKPQLYADSVTQLVTKCTPRKKKALREKGLGILTPKTLKKHATYAKIVANLKLGLKNLKNSQSARKKQMHYVTVKSIIGKHYVENSIRQALDLKMRYWRKLSCLEEEPIPLVTSVSNETKENIKSFYLDNSEHLSSRRNATKKVMTDTLKNAHKTFLSTNQGTKVSLSTFIKRRPKHVLTMDKGKFQSCLCEYCVNIEFKIETLNKLCYQADLKELKLDNKYACVKVTMCSNDNGCELFNDKNCVDRKCSKCGEQKIALHFQPLIEKMGDTEIHWKRWELHSLNDRKNRQMLIEKEGSVLKLVEQLSAELHPFPQHLFIAMWQRKEYQKITSSVPQGNVVLLMDFAENYRCVNQDEIQAAYYQYQQATVFPIIAHYRCDKCKDGIIQESAVVISPDTKHDSSAAHEFIRVMNEHLKETVTIEHEIQYSDGCAGQFKSKKPFQHLSEASNPTIEKCYFGSRHGKSLCDSLGGLVKNQAAKYVRSRKGTIPDAKALYDFSNQNLTVKSESNGCHHKKRTFFYIENIPRQSEENFELQTVKGTQTFHNVKGVSPGVIKVRKLACFCNKCVMNDGSRCENEKTVGAWETKLISRKNKGKLQKGKGRTKSIVSKKRVQSKCTKKRKGKIQKKGKPETAHKEKCASKEAAHVSKKKKCPIKLSCSTFSEMQTLVDSLELEPIPIHEDRTICNSSKAIDANSLPLVPDDIPLKPASQLEPVVIYGDGNCLPRAASFLAFGHEDNHADMRQRIVIELTRNEKMYLDNETMRKGKHRDGNDNVVKMFTMFSSCYMGERLNSRSIQSIYRKEILEIMEPEIWMGVWQVASLANILNRPVVSVCPKFGTLHTRHDMHRVFFPFNDQMYEQTPVFIMWTSMNGKKAEKDFVLNHFTALIPFEAANTDYESDTSCPLSLNISELLDDITAEVELEQMSYDQPPRADVKQQPHVETEQQPREEVKQQPSVEIEQQPGVEAEQQPGMEAEQKPEMEAEQKPEMEAEQKPGMEAEQMPGMEAEKKPGKEAERLPGIEAEQKPEMEAEQKPGMEAEEKPGMEAEQKPGMEAEQKPGMEAEQKPRMEAEQKPGMEAEKKPEMEAEQKPGMEAEQKPGMEAEQKPGMEAEQKPRMEAEQKPGMEAEQRPSVKIEQQSGAEVEQQPEVEAEQQPGVVAEQQPKMEAAQQLHVEIEQQSGVEAEQQASVVAEQLPKLSGDPEENAPVNVEYQPGVDAEQPPRLKVEQQLRTTRLAKQQPPLHAKDEQQPKMEAEQQQHVEIELQSRVEAEQQPSVVAGQPPKLSVDSEQNSHTDAEQQSRVEGNQQPSVEVEQKLHTSRYNIGTHVAVNMGKQVLSAVVVRCPEDILPNEMGLWVQFYDKKGNYSVLAEKKFFVLFEDIERLLENPKKTLVGSRTFYTFETHMQ